MTHNNSLAALVFVWLAATNSAHGADRGQSFSIDVSPQPAALQAMQRQERLVKAADELNELIHNLSPSPLVDKEHGPVGFASIEIDLPGDRLLLFWKSGTPLPPEVGNHLKRMRSVEGLRVEVSPAAIDTREALEEMRRIDREVRSHPEILLAELGPLPGGAGVRAEVETADPVAMRRHRIFSDSDRRLAAVSGVARARLVLEAGTRKRPASRDSDAPPYWGGARVIFPSGSCSTGFSVGNFWGEQAMLTAGHCTARTNGISATNGGGVYMGSTKGAVQTSNNQVSVDTIRISVSLAGGRIYDGGVGAPYEYSKPVKGWGDNYVGLYLCTSGAYSGARCDIRVEQTNTWYYDWIGIQYTNMVRAEQIQHGNAAGEGDSGGPVFSLTSGGADVSARGIVSAVDPAGAPATCTWVINRACSWRLYFNPIRLHLDAHGMWLITG